MLNLPDRKASKLHLTNALIEDPVLSPEKTVAGGL
jgi:hypothetical protein